ncbi:MULTISPECIES: methyl-accepting chemotaxis protein [unclassified Hahella]|uniref:methyl-accepting chemotaxis protein n=1 Tax=unclassified Hahella TaxID=2624107 RepID=UPI001C1ED230|nr:MULTISPECIES: methyl-accepting chemotaxis protein [unclassified Hahella]MBU6955676.1 methyl-accepting chemotaxis protein [Hahella sp. HN01]MDG9670431.1 methyl-accepting chemotaxis protein [Hahella sp. CR1]
MSIRYRYTLFLIVFLAIVGVFTALGIQQWVAPTLVQGEQRNINSVLHALVHEILSELAEVQAQQRVITQTVPLLESDQIDKQLGAMIDQYGKKQVFGGGVWPLPRKRDSNVVKNSTFIHRDGSGKLVTNTYWNSAESQNYYEQSWYKDGLNAPAGQCAWAPAYRDSASPEARTNCSMGIRVNGEAYGVSTIDVTLGFFNGLAAEKEKELNGQLLIFERDGKILNNSSGLQGDAILKNVSELASQSPFLAEVKDYLGSASNQETYSSEYENAKDGEDYSFFVRDVPGTPWLLAVSIKTSLLSAATDSVMSTLAAIQIPIALAIVFFGFLAFTQLSKRLGVLRANIDILSTGEADLTKRIQISSHDEVGNVAESVNKFIKYLAAMIGELSVSSKQISGIVSEVEKQSRENYRMMNKHAGETEQVVTAVTEMAATAESVAKNATETSTFTEEASRSAQKSKETVSRARVSVVDLSRRVSEAVENVNTMRQEAQLISNVINVIRGIAEQTNLLALNAAIEAARAGDQGRGFAVVADEVRALAARTQNSTEEIDGMLNRLESGVSVVVNAMSGMKDSSEVVVKDNEELTQGLDKVLSSFDEINDLNTHIATAAEEQSQVSDKISENMSEISMIISELTKLAQDSEASMNQLSSANEGLNGLVSRFKL